MSSLQFPLLSEHLAFDPSVDEDFWNKPWTVSLRDEPETVIGTVSFAGATIAGEVPINVELKPEFRDQGYGAEIFAFMARWVFRFRNLREVTAVCDHENDKCIHALSKAGYVYREIKGNREYYSIKRQKTGWTGLYVIVGFSAGFMIGLLLTNLWLGTAIGVLAGAITGILLDLREKKG